jgi:hypothetical protein
MSIFREFETAAKDLQSAERAFEIAKARIEAFGIIAGTEIRQALLALRGDGLLAGIDPYEENTKSFVSAPHNQIAIRRIEIRGINAGGLVSSDTVGASVAEALAQAAKNENLRVDHVTNFGHAIEVSDDIQEGEKTPEILLNALAAYARSQGKETSAQLASGAAARMEARRAAFENRLTPKR